MTDLRAAIDPETTRAWEVLEDDAKTFNPDLGELFAQDPERANKLTLGAGDLHVDLSKNLVTESVIADLLGLAQETRVLERRDQMFAGGKINVTEGRAVLHTALRLPHDASLSLGGENIVPHIHKVLQKMYAFSDKVRSGELRGVTGKPLSAVVNIGIGGSDLGPVMVHEALISYVDPKLEGRFISNIDPADVAEKLAGLDPETTLVVVTSKTFTTLETLTNARLVRSWFLDGLSEAGVLDRQDSQAVANAVKKHFVAVSTALDKVEAFGIDPENAFGFWDWVGGRYSVSSAVGLSLVILLGPDNFEDFLAGLHKMDQHFQNAAPQENVPLLMGLLNTWYVNFLGADSHAVIPYSQDLHRFPAYLQQLMMESNGKSVRQDGALVSYDTGEVYWGEPGTNGQHAFFQLLHQGTRLIPSDFIAFVNPQWSLKDGDTDVHELLLSNFFAQTKALAFGKSEQEVRAEGTPEDLVTARIFTGNRPSTSIMAPSLTPGVLGQLISLYEHIAFVQGAVWGIDSFDQWGVELGKALAIALLPAVQGDKEVLDSLDPSTRELISYYRANRK